jgi:cytochrome b-561
VPQVLVLILYQSPSSPNPWGSANGQLAFGDFGLHPCVMVVAFGFCAPIAMVSYKTYEHVLGVSHQSAKLIHASFQTAALVFGAIGVASMWKSHEGKRHFQTAHSWIGIGGFGLFVLQWLMGMLVYLNPFCPGRIRAALMVPHIACGVRPLAQAPAMHNL